MFWLGRRKPNTHGMILPSSISVHVAWQNRVSAGGERPGSVCWDQCREVGALLVMLQAAWLGGQPGLVPEARRAHAGMSRCSAGVRSWRARVSAHDVAPRSLSPTLYLICCCHRRVLIFPFLCSYLFLFSLSWNRWESIIVSHEILRELIASKSMLRAFDDWSNLQWHRVW